MKSADEKAVSAQAQSEAGQSIAIQDGDSELVITRKAGEKLSPQEIEAQLQQIFKGAPQVDCRELLDDLRGCSSISSKRGR